MSGYAVYSLDVDPETYKATRMYALLCGDKDANTDEFNTCNKERVAQPDNVAYVAGHDGLIIGGFPLAATTTHSLSSVVQLPDVYGKAHPKLPIHVEMPVQVRMHQKLIRTMLCGTMILPLALPPAC